MNWLTCFLKLISLIFLASSSCYAIQDSCNSNNSIALETATMAEAANLLPIIAPYKKIRRNDINYYCGTFQNHPILILSTGIGEVYAAAVTASLIHDYNPKFILFLGTAGALEYNISNGSIVVGEYVYEVESYTDFRKNSNQINPNSGTLYSPVLSPDKDLLQLAKSLKFNKHISVDYGRIATTDLFPETDSSIKIIANSNSKAVAMEDYAFIATCQLFHAHCLSIRGISDNPLTILYNHDAKPYQISADGDSIAKSHLQEYARVFLQKWVDENK